MPNVRDFRDPAFRARASSEAIVSVVMAGKGQMPAFGASLSLPKMQALSGYVRRLGADSAPRGPTRDGAAGGGHAAPPSVCFLARPSARPGRSRGATQHHQHARRVVEKAAGRGAAGEESPQARQRPGRRRGLQGGDRRVHEGVRAARRSGRAVQPRRMLPAHRRRRERGRGLPRVSREGSAARPIAPTSRRRSLALDAPEPAARTSAADAEAPPPLKPAETPAPKVAETRAPPPPAWHPRPAPRPSPNPRSPSGPPHQPRDAGPGGGRRPVGLDRAAALAVGAAVGGYLMFRPARRADSRARPVGNYRFYDSCGAAPHATSSLASRPPACSRSGPASATIRSCWSRWRATSTLALAQLAVHRERRVPGIDDGFSGAARSDHDNAAHALHCRAESGYHTVPVTISIDAFDANGYARRVGVHHADAHQHGRPDHHGGDDRLGGAAAVTFALPIVDQPRAPCVDEAPAVDAPAGDSFDDWRWQLRNRITSMEEIAALLPLTAGGAAGLDAAPGHFRVGDHAVLLLAHRSRAPVVPGAHAGDPARAGAGHPSRASWSIRWARTATRPATGIFHRYPDRCLLLALDRCAIYCRHCNRRRLVGRRSRRSRARISSAALDYIRAHARHPRRADLGRRSADAVDDRLEEILAAAARHPARRDHPHRHPRPGGVAHARRRRAVRDAARAITRCSSTPTSTTPRS